MTDRKTGLVATCWSSDRVSKMLCVPSGEKRLGGCRRVWQGLPRAGGFASMSAEY